MTFLVPQKTIYTFKQGMTGIGVWSLQRALSDVGPDLVLDGVFGPGTEKVVIAFQKLAGLTADGIAGPATQRALATRECDDAERAYALPDRLLEGFAEGEGGWLLAPVNHMIAGGTDCGLFQRRLYESDYGDQDAIKRAFNTLYQGKLLSGSLVERRGAFIARAGTNDRYGEMPVREKAWRLAALNHNYPAGADRLSRTPILQLPSYWTTPQTWVTSLGFKFPTGALVRTPLEWCHLYAGVLGAGVKGTKGSVTRFVSSWP